MHLKAKDSKRSYPSSIRYCHVATVLIVSVLLLFTLQSTDVSAFTCVTKTSNLKTNFDRYEATTIYYNSRRETQPVHITLRQQDQQQHRRQYSKMITKLHLVTSNNNNNNNALSNSTNVKQFHPTPIMSGVSAVAIITAIASAVVFANPAFAKSFSLSASAANNWLSTVAETGFYQAFSLVFVSEIGDKTFFIAGLLAMKTSKIISFIGSMGALAAMTIISVVIGQLFHAVPTGLLGDGVTIPWDDVAAVAAFAFFGIKILRDALAMDDSSGSGGGAMGEELEEAKQVVNEQDTNKSTIQTILGIFGLVFAAEFGDRSFISTIALSAAQNPVSVAGGAIAAHAAATGLAVSGGAVIAKYLSEKVIGIVGGTLFIVFAITTALGIF